MTPIDNNPNKPTKKEIKLNAGKFVKPLGSIRKCFTSIFPKGLNPSSLFDPSEADFSSSIQRTELSALNCVEQFQAGSSQAGSSQAGSSQAGSSQFEYEDYNIFSSNLINRWAAMDGRPQIINSAQPSVRELYNVEPFNAQSSRVEISENVNIRERNVQTLLSYSSYKRPKDQIDTLRGSIQKGLSLKTLLSIQNHEQDTCVLVDAYKKTVDMYNNNELSITELLEFQKKYITAHSPNNTNFKIKMNQAIEKCSDFWQLYSVSEINEYNRLAVKKIIPLIDEKLTFAQLHNCGFLKNNEAALKAADVIINKMPNLKVDDFKFLLIFLEHKNVKVREAAFEKLGQLRDARLISFNQITDMINDKYLPIPVINLAKEHLADLKESGLIGKIYDAQQGYHHYYVKKEQ